MAQLGFDGVDGDLRVFSKRSAKLSRVPVGFNGFHFQQPGFATLRCGWKKVISKSSPKKMLAIFMVMFIPWVPRSR